MGQENDPHGSVLAVPESRQRAGDLAVLLPEPGDHLSDEAEPEEEKTPQERDLEFYAVTELLNKRDDFRTEWLQTLNRLRAQAGLEPIEI